MILYVRNSLGSDTMYRIIPLKIGECTCRGPLACFLSDWDQSPLFYYYCWLLRGSENNILVDTGFDLSEARRFMPDMQQADHEALLPQLAKQGLSAGDIDTVIITHVHFDHCSSLLERFDHADIVLQQSELAYHLDPPHPWFSQFTLTPLLRKINTQWKPRLRLVEGEAKIAAGVTVFHVGGHTAGLQCVKVQTAEGPAVITSDVVFTYQNLQRDVPVGFAVNLEQCYRAMARIRREFRPELIIPSHDPLVMQRWSPRT